MAPLTNWLDVTEHELLRAWSLEPDGPVYTSGAARVTPVHRDGCALVLKVILPESDELQAAVALKHYDGIGAVRLLCERNGSQLLERLLPGSSLLDFVIETRDDANAMSHLVEVARNLHRADRQWQVPRLTPFRLRIEPLFTAVRHGSRHFEPVLQEAAKVADRLLQTERDVMVLHGDLHHENILWDDKRGWLAIDPKGLIGERTYDFANALCNPIALPGLVMNRQRFSARVHDIVRLAHVDLKRLVDFAFCHSTLYAVPWEDEADNYDPFWMSLAEMIYEWRESHLV